MGKAAKYLLVKSNISEKEIPYIWLFAVLSADFLPLFLNMPHHIPSEISPMFLFLFSAVTTTIDTYNRFMIYFLLICKLISCATRIKYYMPVGTTHL